MINECEKPTIAMIPGVCIGGGVGVALSLRAFKKTANLLLKSAAGAVTAECGALIRDCFESADYAQGRRPFHPSR